MAFAREPAEGRSVGHLRLNGSLLLQCSRAIQSVSAIMSGPRGSFQGQGVRLMTEEEQYGVWLQNLDLEQVVVVVVGECVVFTQPIKP